MRVTRNLRHSIAVLVIAALALGSVRAWAGFDAREREVSERVKNTEKITEGERKELLAGFSDYFDKREKCLVAAVDRIAIRDDKPLHGAWLAFVDSCFTTAMRDIAESLDDIDTPSLAALGLVGVVGLEENAFVTALMATSAAESRDTIVRIGEQLDEMTENLDKKWTLEAKLDDALDKRIEKTSREVQDIFKKSLAQAARRHSSAKEKLLQVLAIIADNPTVSPGHTGWHNVDLALNLVKGAVAIAAKNAITTSALIQARIDSYSEIVRRESGVFVVLGEIRDDVREFLKENDFPRVQRSFDEAEASLAAFTSAQKTSAQKADADSVVKKVRKILNGHLNAVEERYEDFVDRHKYRFFGPIGPNTKRELLEQDSWKTLASAVNSLSVDSKLRQWQRAAESGRALNVSLSGLTSEQRDYIQRQLRSDFDRLVAALKRERETEKRLRNALSEFERTRSEVLKSQE